MPRADVCVLVEKIAPAAVQRRQIQRTVGRHQQVQFDDCQIDRHAAELAAKTVRDRRPVAQVRRTEPCFRLEDDRAMAAAQEAEDVLGILVDLRRMRGILGEAARQDAGHRFVRAGRHRRGVAEPGGVGGKGGKVGEAAGVDPAVGRGQRHAAKLVADDKDHRRRSGDSDLDGRRIEAAGKGHPRGEARSIQPGKSKVAGQSMVTTRRAGAKRT